jgi:hypothetical protein
VPIMLAQSAFGQSPGSAAPKMLIRPRR